MKPRFSSGRDDGSRGGKGRPSLWLAVPLAILLAGASFFAITWAASSLSDSRAAANAAGELSTLVSTTHKMQTAQTGPTPGSELSAGIAILQLEPAVQALTALGSSAQTDAMTAAFEQIGRDVAAGEQAIVTGQSDTAAVNATVGASNQAFIEAVSDTAAGLQSQFVTAERIFTLLAGIIFAATGVAIAAAVMLFSSHRNATETMRRRRDEHFRGMTQFSGDVISLVDQTGKVTAQSSSLLRLLGRSDLGMIGRPFADLVSEADRAPLAELIQTANKRPGEPATGRIDLVHSDGSLRPMDVTAVSQADQTHLDGVLLTCRSVSESASSTDVDSPAAAGGVRLQHPVSGMLTEPLFRDRLAHALNRTARSADPVSLLVIELGNEQTFTGLSDDAQATILRAIAGRLARSIRGGDSVAHLRGFEFAVILEETNLESARMISRRVFEQLSPPVAHMNGRIRLTPRIGIAVKTDPRDTVDTLLLDARTALSGKEPGTVSEASVAPAHGHGPDPRVVAPVAPVPPATPSIIEPPKPLLASFLTDSPAAKLEAPQAQLDGVDAFEMQFLPVLALESGEVVEIEAIARWRHPERGLVPVEHSGRMDIATSWMLEQACRLAPMLPVTRAGRQVRVSINISPLTPLDDVLVDTVATSLLASGMTPSSLQLELAARVMDSGTVERVLPTLQQLRELGVRLVLDGAGTDADRQPDFARLPVNGVKLDRSVVTMLDRSAERRAQARSLIDQAKANGVSVIGVGVETLEQAERLWDLGADAGQGPLFFRPIGQEQLPALFATEQAMAAAD